MLKKSKNYADNYDTLIESLIGRLRSMSYSNSARRFADGKPNEKDLTRAGDDAGVNRNDLLKGHYMKRLSKKAKSYDDVEKIKEKAIESASDKERTGMAYDRLSKSVVNRKGSEEWDKDAIKTSGRRLARAASSLIDDEGKQKESAPKMTPTRALTENVDALRAMSRSLSEGLFKKRKLEKTDIDGIIDDCRFLSLAYDYPTPCGKYIFRYLTTHNDITDRGFLAKAASIWYNWYVDNLGDLAADDVPARFSDLSNGHRRQLSAAMLSSVKSMLCACGIYTKMNLPLRDDADIEAVKCQLGDMR
jgi:hypothetical protein